MHGCAHCSPPLAYIHGASACIRKVHASHLSIKLRKNWQLERPTVMGVTTRGPLHRPVLRRVSILVDLHNYAEACCTPLYLLVDGEACYVVLCCAATGLMVLACEAGSSTTVCTYVESSKSASMTCDKRSGLQWRQQAWLCGRLRCNCAPDRKPCRQHIAALHPTSACLRCLHASAVGILDISWRSRRAKLWLALH
jgi:hypothetical protein